MTSILRISFVYAHLLILIVAMGSVLLADYRLIRSFMRHWRSSRQITALPAIENTKITVAIMLPLLWATGLLIIAVDLYAGSTVSAKLITKLLATALLTVNGFLLHWAVLPHYKTCQSWHDFIQHAQFRRMLLLGSISSYLWLASAFIGVIKELKSMSLAVGLTSLLIGLIMVGVFSQVIAHFVSTKSRLDPDFSPNQSPPPPVQPHE
jgi:hypothetical protein